MSLCENPDTFPRGKFCKHCPLGKTGYVSKIFNALENDGAVGRLAGKIWLKRGGGISNQPEYDADKEKARKRITVMICKTSG